MAQLADEGPRKPFVVPEPAGGKRHDAIGSPVHRPGDDGAPVPAAGIVDAGAGIVMRALVDDEGGERPVGSVLRPLTLVELVDGEVDVFPRGIESQGRHGQGDPVRRILLHRLDRLVLYPDHDECLVAQDELELDPAELLAELVEPDGHPRDRLADLVQRPVLRAILALGKDEIDEDAAEEDLAVLVETPGRRPAVLSAPVSAVDAFRRRRGRQQGGGRLRNANPETGGSRRPSGEKGAESRFRRRRQSRAGERRRVPRDQGGQPRDGGGVRRKPAEDGVRRKRDADVRSPPLERVANETEGGVIAAVDDTDGRRLLSEGG